MTLADRSLELHLRGHVRFGVGALATLPGLVREAGGERVFVVSDPGVVRSGVTAQVFVPTQSVPDQQPVCAKRLVLNSTRPCLRMNWRGSSQAGIAPCQVRSAAIPNCVGSSTKRTRSSGFWTSTRNGPTVVSMRSPSSREARTTLWSGPQRTTANASCTPRLGYWPRPITMKSSSLEPCRLK